jgi:hypothetical protein
MQIYRHDFAAVAVFVKFMGFIQPVQRYVQPLRLCWLIQAIVLIRRLLSGNQAEALLPVQPCDLPALMSCRGFA